VNGPTYVARLLPLDRTIRVTNGQGRRSLEHFAHGVFALERKQPGRVQVLLDHDERKAVGHLEALWRHDGWLLGSFQLDKRSSWELVAEDRLRIGCPISVGYTPTVEADVRGDGIKRMLCGLLDEVSLVDVAAIPGAEIVYRWAAPKQTTRTKTPTPGEEIIDTHGQVIRRPIGQALRVR
jgi:hypothetical protein